MVEKTSVASNTLNRTPAAFASMAAAMPETPAPMIATSSSSGSVGFRKPGSARMAFSARAPLSEENLSSGMPVRSPTMRTPGTTVAPPSPDSGSRSTVPAGHCVCSHFMYLPIMGWRPADAPWAVGTDRFGPTACRPLTDSLGP
jgi:hypothetical protein